MRRRNRTHQLLRRSPVILAPTAIPANLGAGRLTVVNVETLSNMPAIMVNGVDWYTDLPKKRAVKLQARKYLGARDGLTMRDCGNCRLVILLEKSSKNLRGHADGLTLKAWLPGGASTDFLTADHLDLPMDFDSIQGAGSRMGLGSMVVDSTQDMVALQKNLQIFFQRESCGWCPMPRWLAVGREATRCHGKRRGANGRY